MMLSFLLFNSLISASYGQILPILQGLLGSTGSTTAINGNVLSQGLSALEGLRSRVDSPVIAQFADQLREIFQSSALTGSSIAAPESALPMISEPDAADKLRHAIRGINPRSPFDLSALAEAAAEHEVIQLTPSGDSGFLTNRLGQIIGGLSGGALPNLLGGVLGAQSRLADEKMRRSVPAFASEQDFPPKRGLQDLQSSAKQSILSTMLGVPGRSGGLYGRFDDSSTRTSSEVPPSLSSSKLRQAFMEEEEALSASRFNKVDSVPPPPLPISSASVSAGSETHVEGMGAYQECFIPNSIVIGPEDLVMRSKDILHCQGLCQQNIRCKYCTFRYDEKLCYHYNDADRLEGSKTAISAPKSCPGVQSSMIGASNVAGSATAAPHPIDDSKQEESASGMASIAAAGLLGGASAPNILHAATSMMATGSQFMGAIPFKELAQAGMTLAENGYLRNRGMTRGLGARTKDKTQVPPPPGSGRPSVTCHAQGMTCCIPRTALTDWQRHIPYLNQYKSIEACQSIYVSTQDTLCVTSVYEGETNQDRCGVQIAQMNDITVYRNTLTVPNKTLNNALCECIHNSGAEDEEDKSPVGSARWEYSLAAAENARSKLDQTEESATRLVKGAQAAQVLSQIFSNGGGGGGGGKGSPGVAAVGDMIGLAGNLSSFMNNRRSK